MHANVSGGDRSGGKSWQIPPDETLQIGADKKDKDQDLYGSDGHNWRSIIFSLLVIGFVIAGIVTAIYLLGYVDELLYWSGKRMKFDEYLQNEISPKRLPSTWVTNTKFVYQSDDGSLAILDTANDSVATLVTNHTLRQLNVQGYQCTSDLRYVLFTHDVKFIYKNSYTALFTVYDVTNDHHMPVRLKDSPKNQRMRMQHAEFLGNTTTLVLIHENDIYIRQSPADEEDIRLTSTGVAGLIYNGVTDWLYQEEVLKSQKAIWSSNDGLLLLYASFNDTNVGQMVYPWFSSNKLVLQAGGLTSKGSFPDAQSIRYPTPGTLNPEVTLWLLDLTNFTDVQKYEIKQPASLEGQESYIVSANFITTPAVVQSASIVWMSRPQNYSVVSTCFSPNWTCVETHSERAPEDEWLDILPHPVFSLDGDSFMLLAGIQETGTEHFTHIKHVTITQQRISVISHGRYEQHQAVVTNGIQHQVVRILAWDTFNHLVYYLGTQDKKPGQQHLYTVRDPVNEDPRSSLNKIDRTEPQCITCESSETLWRSKDYYSNCTHFEAYVAPKSSITTDAGVDYYILECRGPSLPFAGVHSAKSHKLVRILYDTRKQFQDKLQSLALPSQRSFEISLTHGTRAAVQMLFPPSWREELRDAAFPVLVEVNGKPGETSVVDEFRIDWGTYMSSHNDIVYIRLDVRGAKGQGKKKLFRHLGGVEVDDQIAAVEHLLNNMKYLDKSRVGVWGWGFGGYVTTMILGSNKKVFKCGIAVSPISDWIYYNSAFTERIMGLPIENYKAYVEADATQRVRNIPSDSYFLIHGLADATAPYHHSVQLAKALTSAGKIFRYTSYADEGHDLRGVQEHVYRSMEHYYRDCLSLDSDVEGPNEDHVPTEPIKFIKYFFHDKNQPKSIIMD
ncbi:hypothetical protein ACKWTF_007126 [Chironomus riparius]